MKGTPCYSAPEMWESSLYDSKTDIWSLGCCLFEMCCGYKAFDSSNFRSLFQKIKNESPPNFGEKAKEILSEESYIFFSDLFQRCVQTNPHHRPSIDDLLSDKSKEQSNQ